MAERGRGWRSDSLDPRSEPKSSPRVYLCDDAVTSPRKERNLLISVERGVLLRVETAAILLGIGRTKMYDLIGRGQISVVRIGRRTLVHRDDLERFGQEQRDQQGDASETPT